MGSAAKSYVEREEFEAVKKTLETLTIRVEVLTSDLHRLTQNVGDLAESVDRRFDALETMVRDGHAELRRAIDDGQAALMSAVLSLGRR